MPETFQCLPSSLSVIKIQVIDKTQNSILLLPGNLRHSKRKPVQEQRLKNGLAFRLPEPEEEGMEDVYGWVRVLISVV